MINDHEIASARILLVDDEEDNLVLLELLLRSAGYQQIHATPTPAEVAALHRAHDFDLILLDLNMPGHDGFQVMAELEALALNDFMPVLVLSALKDDEIRLRALSAGARDFVAKPFDRVEVLTRIRNMAEVHLLHRRLKEQNRDLDELVRERTQELLETQLEILRRLGRAAEFRDNETGLHVTRMSRYTHLLALASGMAPGAAEELLHAAAMHDLGKIGVPDQILFKPGKLDPEEWTLMRAHTTIGAELLSGHASPLLETARVVALTHHERWDGTGYPQGLAGEAIPLAGRIAAIADVFDALTSDRPYKQAWPFEQAVAEIRRSAGSHFDPMLVERFLAILPQVRAIHEEYAEPASRLEARIA